jgi:hypothetical protein
MVQLILLVLAFVLTLLEAFYPWFYPTATRPHLGWLGVAFAILAFALGQGGILR